MKQAKLLALTITLIILCGCSKTSQYEGEFSTWRQNCLSIDKHEIEAVVTASDNEKVCEYTLLYKKEGEMETVEVLAPELIADIKANIQDDDTRLSYEGAILETGSTLSENLSPLMALPVFMDIVKEGHTEIVWREKKDGAECLVADLEMPDGMIMTIWLDITDKTPVYADLRSKERVEVKIDFKKFN